MATIELKAADGHTFSAYEVGRKARRGPAWW